MSVFRIGGLSLAFGIVEEKLDIYLKLLVGRSPVSPPAPFRSWALIDWLFTRFPDPSIAPPNRVRVDPFGGAGV